MAAVAQELLELQKLDSEIGRLMRQVDQLTAAIGDQLKVKAGDYAIRQAEEALRKRTSDQRDREHELAQVEQRIKEHEERLYSGKGSPRDLQALQRDIEHDRGRRAELEERALGAMDLTEKAQTELARVRAAVAKALSETSAGKERQATERDQALAALEQVRARREQRATAVSAAALQLYDRLRAKLADRIAVAEVVQSRCQGCHDTITSAEVQRARRPEELVQCGTCQRVIVVR